MSLAMPVSSAGRSVFVLLIPSISPFSGLKTSAGQHLLAVTGHHALQQAGVHAGLDCQHNMLVLLSSADLC